MDDDIRENFAKIIQAKTKQIKLQADKFETQIKSEVQRIISIQDSITLLKKESQSDEVKIEEEIKLKEIEIKAIRKKIKELNKEKFEALGCEMNIGFTDDHFIKTDYELQKK